MVSEADTAVMAVTTADACTAELILLSSAALFHTLIIDVMLPVRWASLGFRV